MGLYPMSQTGHRPDAFARRTFQAGASGYVTKQEMTETLLIAIRCVLRGEKYVSPRISAGLDTT